MTGYIIPFVTAAVIIYGLVRKTDVFSAFAEGARENLTVCADILPSLIALVTSVGMLRASGVFDMLTGAVSGIADRLGFPAVCLPLALIRPVSGSGALAVFEDIISTFGPDSFAGRTASVMLGSTETTFYTVAVYYGAAGIKKTRHTVPAALMGDIAGFVISVLTVRILFGQ